MVRYGGLVIGLPYKGFSIIHPALRLMAFRPRFDKISNRFVMRICGAREPSQPKVLLGTDKQRCQKHVNPGAAIAAALFNPKDGVPYITISARDF